MNQDHVGEHLTPPWVGRRMAQCDRCLTYTEVEDTPGPGPGRFCDRCMSSVFGSKDGES